jgi:hypothetical protein
VLVGLNPIVLVWGLGAGHNDFLMIVCIMFGFYVLVRTRALPEASPQASPRALPGASPRAPRRRLRPPRPAEVRGWLIPLAPLQLLAGASFVLAAGIKASAAVLIPVVLAGLLRAPRALVQVALGMILGAIGVAAVSVAAFGVHLPDLSTQGSLVTGESVPNLIGLALGLGGETDALRKVMVLVLILAVLTCCWLAWRRTDTITAAGWSSVALLLALAWVLPWYVLWVLPMAALSRSRWLRGTSLVLGAYLIIAWAPVTGLLWKAIGFRPEQTPLGRLHQRFVKELLD